MPIITSLADKGIFWILIAVVMLFFRKTRKMGITMGVALVLGLALGNGVLKNLFNRTRPFDVVEGIEPLIEWPHDPSFPSGHTLASFEAAGAMMFYNKKFGISALVVASLIAFSRMYLYVHYPTDILGGIVFGLLFAFLGYLIVNYVYKKFGFDSESEIGKIKE
ncbi:MAG: phosphatase PAP2 family protein [Clostridia bacterium]|nr:phosphatase PAP2 family protein [Clostridia bacterium]